MECWIRETLKPPVTRTLSHQDPFVMRHRSQPTANRPPHLVASYDTQGGAGDQILPRVPTGTMLYKIIHREVEIPIHHLLVTNSRVTRGTQANNIRQISTRVDVYKFSFLPSTITAWNGLPSEARAAPSVDSFRQAIQNLGPAIITRY